MYVFSDLVIWKRLRFSTYVVRFRVTDELDRRNLGNSLHQRLADSMHSVHDSASLVEDHWVGEISLDDQRTMLNDASAAWNGCPVAVPVTLVQLSHFREQDLPNR
jgi:hypothetical protein